MRRPFFLAAPILLAALLVGGLWYAGATRFSSADIIATCKEVTEKDLCYTEAIINVLKTHGLSTALEVAADSYNADPSFFATCHAVMHELGKAAYEEFHMTGEVELSEKTSYCGYGFYHGFMEELLYQTNDYAEARKFCAYAGKVVPTPPGYAEGACYHGIGHGVTDGTDPRLWGSAQKIVAPGLSLCASVAGENIEWHQRCASGVFNSVALFYREPKYRLDARGNPFGLCAAASFSAVEKRACYDQMNTLATHLAGYDFATAIRSVQKVADPEYRKIAVRGVTATYLSSVRSKHQSISAKTVSDACASLGTLGNECIVGIIGGIQEFGTPGVEYTDMFPLCESAELNEKFVATCWASVITSTDWFYGEATTRTVCAKIPERYRTPVCTT